MKNTLIHHSFVLILLAGMLSGSCRQQGVQEHLEGPVNILFIFTDDQRWDALGYAGNEVIRTPNLDRLAARGTYFDNAFVTTSICCVSRASVLTGQYGRYSGVEDFFTPIRLETTYPRYLREAGYYTGFIGKWGTQERDTGYFMKAADLFDFWAGSMGQSNYWHERNCNFVRNNGTTEKHHFLCDCPPDARGFRGEEIRVGKAHIKDPVNQETYVIPLKARMFLDQRDEEKPFCLSISFKSPHGPWSDYDEKFEHAYEGQTMPVAASVDEQDARSRPEFLQRSLNGIRELEKIRTAREIEGPLSNSMRQYYRLINGMDQAVGEILQELKDRGLFDNTVIIFYSDNGQFMWEHGFKGKWLMYEESLRVPGFVFDPRDIKDGARSQEMVLNIDLAPTILDLAGLEIPEHMQGQSLLPLLKDPDRPFREDFFYEHLYRHMEGYMHIERSEGLRTRDWKYIRYIDQDGPASEELYHLSADPLEMHDLSGDPGSAGVMEKLKQRYLSYFQP
jgi:arylsulfatase A-like enzyme